MWWAMTPEWCELRITVAASGEAESPSRRDCCASSIAGYANPSRASTMVAESLSRIASGTACPSTLPLRACAA